MYSYFEIGCLSRRSFLKAGLVSAVGFCFGCPVNQSAAANAETLQEACFYEKQKNKSVRCHLCFRSCTIREGKRGFCRNRENQDGTLYSLAYGLVTLQHDPIEKEPMYHNLPGSTILCSGSASCNFRCRFCHNWHLSQRTIEELAPNLLQLTPATVVAEASKRGAGLSFTYNEPTVFYEFMYDVAKLGAAKGINTIFHTNGGMQKEPMKKLLLHMKGVTVDLKGFTADYYRNVSFAKMTPVLETLKLIKEQGRWLEIVNLVVPTMNDNLSDIREMCQWIVENLGPEIPLHFSRFFPAYKMKYLPPTPIKTLEKAQQIATAAGLHYVYIGNVPGHKFNSTYCPQCKKKIISRSHFFVHSVQLQADRCKYCDHPIPGLWG